MIDPTTKLTILHDDNGSFTDYKDLLADFMRDTATIDLNSSVDYLYIGFEKPINAVYNEFTTPNTNANTFAAERYDEATTAWVSLDLTDETMGWTRSGYMYWDSTDMGSVEVDGITKYWIRLRPSADHTSAVIRGLNLVFADDNAIRTEFPEITNSRLLPPGEVSHINVHVASRNRIVQMLRNEDYIKQNSISSNIIKATQWDLFDIFEVKQAAVHLALSKIFFNLSDQVDDHWWNKYREHQRMFERTLPKARLSFDSDNDGEKDTGEVSAPILVQRFNR